MIICVRASSARAEAVKRNVWEGEVYGNKRMWANIGRMVVTFVVRKMKKITKRTRDFLCSSWLVGLLACFRRLTCGHITSHYISIWMRILCHAQRISNVNNREATKEGEMEYGTRATGECADGTGKSERHRIRLCKIAQRRSHSFITSLFRNLRFCHISFLFGGCCRCSACVIFIYMFNVSYRHIRFVK